MIDRQETIDWLLDSDPSLRWRVERDLLGAPDSVWKQTKAQVAVTGFGAKVLSCQDPDGQWAGGAYFPTREEPRAKRREDGDKGQPYIATTWSLNELREFGVAAEALGDTAARIDSNSKWEYDDLPYWGGEVDCCINAFTLQNGIWLGLDMRSNLEWFLEHQLEDGGWNCEWVNGDTRSSFHSTLNSLFGLLDYEQQVGADQGVAQARQRAEEYLLARRLMFKLSTNERVGPWIHDLAYPFRWSYSIIRALNYFRDSALFSGADPDPRIGEAAAWLASMANENGRWVTNDRLHGMVWVEVDGAVGEESKWLTFYALRALSWWHSRSMS